jgi:hypothetical protein
MEPHATRIVVWDVPSAIECGAAFRFKVGVRCAEDCSAAARRVEICDAAGGSLAVAAVGDRPFPGTDALHFAELELRAPPTEGAHVWQARVAAAEAGADADDRPAHTAASAVFHVRAVPPPDCVLKVIAVDARSGIPVPGARVVVHPYHAMTNLEGVAELKVPKGAYRLFVSGRDRFPFRADGEVHADTTIRAELDLDLGPSDAELWS